MVTGRIESGIVKVGDEVEVIGITAPQKTIVTGALGRTKGRVWRCVQLLPVFLRLPVRVHAMYPRLYPTSLCIAERRSLR